VSGGKELRRYRVLVTSRSGRTLPRTVATHHGELKAVAMAVEGIHRQLGFDSETVSAAEVAVEDLGRVASGTLRDGDLVDRWEF
jgi:hypothetical protein